MTTRFINSFDHGHWAKDGSNNWISDVRLIHCLNLIGCQINVSLYLNNIEQEISTFHATTFAIHYHKNYELNWFSKFWQILTIFYIVGCIVGIYHLFQNGLDYVYLLIRLSFPLFTHNLYYFFGSFFLKCSWARTSGKAKVAAAGILHAQNTMAHYVIIYFTHTEFQVM